MPAVTLTIGAATCAKFAAEYLGLIESVSENTSKLRHTPFISAINWFENARRATDKKAMESYLNDARREFMDAITLEDDENRVAAILGLSMCQQMLGDSVNAKANLQKINHVTLSKSARNKIIALNVVGDIFPPLRWYFILSRPTIQEQIQIRKKELELFKEKALRLNNKVLQLPN